MPADALIINADDVGYAPAINRGIFAAWAQQAISDSTAFANAADLPFLLRQAGQLGLPVGIHLNLTAGQPICLPDEIPALVSPDGTFLRRKQWASPLPTDQVECELRRQVERFLELGWPPSHLDSHHHVHGYPELLAVSLELARELRLPLRAPSPAVRVAAKLAGVPTPDHFSMEFYGEKTTVETLIRLTEECPGGTLEIMTHPGYASPDNPGSYRDEREQELRALTDPRWQDYLAERGIAIVGFAVFV